MVLYFNIEMTLDIYRAMMSMRGVSILVNNVLHKPILLTHYVPLSRAYSCYSKYTSSISG